jgi:hypothetical protein
MRRSRKLILIALLGIVVLAGSIGGVALANTGGEEESQPEARFGAFLEKVCEIYNANTDPEDIYPDIDCEALKEAFAEARSQMRPEGMPNRGEMDPEAMLERLENLHNQGKISDEQYAKMTERIESMPDNLPGFGLRGSHGFRGFHRFGGPCAPQTTE